MATRTNTIALIRRIIKDTDADTTRQNLLDAEIEDSGIDPALARLSRDLPYEKSVDLLGADEQNLHLPVDFDMQFSRILILGWDYAGVTIDPLDPNEFLIVEPDMTQRATATISATETQVTLSTVADAVYIKDGDPIRISDVNYDATDSSTFEENWASADGNTTTGVVTLKNAVVGNYSSSPIIIKAPHLRLTADVPSSSDILLMKYTPLHIHSDSADTIPSGDYRAFTKLAAGLCCYAIADKFANSYDNNFGTDQSDFGGRAEVWRNLARDHIEFYENHIGRPDTGKASETNFALIDIDTDRRKWRHGYIYHSRRIF